MNRFSDSSYHKARCSELARSSHSSAPHPHTPQPACARERRSFLCCFAPGLWRLTILWRGERDEPKSRHPSLLCPHHVRTSDPLFPCTQRHPSPPSLRPGVKKDYRLDLFSRFPTYLKPTYVHRRRRRKSEKKRDLLARSMGTPQQESSSPLVLMHDRAY